LTIIELDKFLSIIFLLNKVKLSKESTPCRAVHKSRRSQEVCPVRNFADKKEGFFGCGHPNFLVQKNFGFFLIYTRGVEPVQASFIDGPCYETPLFFHRTAK